uniref:Cl1856_1 n=1 Tax=Arundo donax TaxID=35708 RepID=A0A0A9AMY0_ARUDO
MPSLVVTEQRSTLRSSVRQELAENSVTSSVAASYLETRTTHAPQPPATR